MDIQEAELQQKVLLARLRQGQITKEAYAAAVGALRVTDNSGRVWQPDPGGTGWLVWNGSAWEPANPPATGYAGPPSDKTSRIRDTKNDRSSLMTGDEFRKISSDVPLKDRPQRWWDRFSVLLGITVAVIWFLYSSFVPVYSLLTGQRMQEEFDLLSPILMVVIPLILIWQRKRIDDQLMFFQPTRNRISRNTLLGMGIAVPFLTAFLIYHVFQIDQYPLMWCNLVVGTMVSYGLIREPVLADNYRPGMHGGRTPDVRVPLFLLLLSSICVRIVLADNCLTDPLNARDCMRTTGSAELISGGVSAGFSSAVNGPTMIQLISGGSGTAATANAVGASSHTGTSSPAGMSADGVVTGGPEDNPNTEYGGGDGPGGCPWP